MTSLERVLTTLSHREPDRVPFFLLATMHGAKETGLSLRDYFGEAANVVEGQRRLRNKYHDDAFYSFHYASLEIEAWGGETIFRDDGPPNSGEPIIKNPERIAYLVPPRIGEAPVLRRVLEVIKALNELAKGEMPVIGVVMSPFSIPVMQMGFEAYLDLVFDRPELHALLMRVNSDFCVEWGNAQLASGAAAIVYFDPVSSPTIIPPDIYRKTGFPIACDCLRRINGPVVIHLASGIALPIIDELTQTGAVGIGISGGEDLDELKSACRGRLAMVGNLNGITMRTWTTQQAENTVRETITRAGLGGGYILADNHGEIPWQVPDEVLSAISEAVHVWGRYPLGQAGRT
jgi:uroporphyrinogen decarboxylase